MIFLGFLPWEPGGVARSKSHLCLTMQLRLTVAWGPAGIRNVFRERLNFVAPCLPTGIRLSWSWRGKVAVERNEIWQVDGAQARKRTLYFLQWGFPCSLVGKESACNAGYTGLIPGSGRSPREGNSNPLQYSCLENPMDREALQATVHGVTRVGHDLTSKPSPLPPSSMSIL